MTIQLISADTRVHVHKVHTRNITKLTRPSVATPFSVKSRR